MHPLLPILLLTATTAATAQTPYCTTLKTLTQDPTVAAAHWGLSVTTLDGTPLCTLNDAQLFHPASANKLFTSAAAIALLGLDPNQDPHQDRRLTTTLFADGPLDPEGRLHGNLRLFGTGDPSFGSANLPYPRKPAPELPTIADIEDLAAQAVAKGLRAVDGDILGDDSFFQYEPYPPDWAADDLQEAYGAPVSALTLHNNAIQFQVAPSPEPTGVALVTQAPDVTFYTVQSTVRTADFGHPYHCDDRLRFSRDLGSHTVTLRGDIGPRVAPCTDTLAIDDPALYAAQALRESLIRHGVTVTGTTAVRHGQLPEPSGRLPPLLPDVLVQKALSDGALQPANCPATTTPTPVAARNTSATTSIPLATHTSAPLLEDLIYTVKTSQNLHAELFLAQLSATRCAHSRRESLAIVRQYLLQAGLARTDFVLVDGSGLSEHDLVTPRAFTRLLTYAARQPWFPAWKSTLPIGGVDGTLAARFTTDLKGRVFAKTGTLGESRALAGYVTADSGNTLVFSILVDNHPPNTTADRTVMDKLVEAIAAAN